MADYTDTFENKLYDFLFRGETLVIGASTATWDTDPTYYFGLLSTVGNDAGSEVECTGTDYARVGLQASLTNYKGTHGTTTGASSGTDGTGENAVVIQFAAPGAGGWGTAAGFGIYEASTGGSPIMKSAFSNGSQTINEGNDVKFAADAMALQVDD